MDSEKVGSPDPIMAGEIAFGRKLVRLKLSEAGMLDFRRREDIFKAVLECADECWEQIDGLQAELKELRKTPWFEMFLPIAASLALLVSWLFEWPGLKVLASLFFFAFLGVFALRAAGWYVRRHDLKRLRLVERDYLFQWCQSGARRNDFFSFHDLAKEERQFTGESSDYEKLARRKAHLLTVNREEILRRALGHEVDIDADQGA